MVIGRPDNSVRFVERTVIRFGIDDEGWLALQSRMYRKLGTKTREEECMEFNL
jgi:hypothetical protein